MSQGILIPIGGAEDKTSSRLILKRFVELSGGNRARLVVIPSASGFPMETASLYTRIFTELGAEEVRPLHLKDRQSANDRWTCDLLEGATGVFLTGGDQLKLISMMGGTQLAKALNAHFNKGLHISGTSAGASAMSRHMIAFGRSGAIASQRMVQLASGLGLTESYIIDQHFSQRDRLGRLTTAVALNPGYIGVGIDEDTAFMIYSDNTCEVIGSGTVTIVDGRQLEYTDIFAVKRHNPVHVTGIHPQVLAHGQYFQLEEMQVAV